MTSPVRLLGILALCASAGLAACGDAPSAPGEPLAGRYLLRAVDGRPLPHALSSGPVVEHTLLSEAITFDASGTATRERTIRQARPQAGRDTTYTLVLQAAYRRSGTHVEIGWFTPCPPGANCLGNDVGTVDETGMVLASSLYATGPGAPPVLVYTRP